MPPAPVVISGHRKRQMLAILNENPTFTKRQLFARMQEINGVQVRSNRLTEAFDEFHASRKSGVVSTPDASNIADPNLLKIDREKYGSWDGNVASIPGAKTIDDTPDMRDNKNKRAFLNLSIPEVAEPVPTSTKVPNVNRTPRPSVSPTPRAPVATPRKERPTMSRVEAPPEPVAKKTDAFVPPKLLSAIGSVMKACKDAGGYDSALGIANAIKSCGGVENFQSAVDLLRKVSQEPAQLGGIETTMSSNTPDTNDDAA